MLYRNISFIRKWFSIHAYSQLLFFLNRLKIFPISAINASAHLRFRKLFFLPLISFDYVKCILLSNSRERERRNHVKMHRHKIGKQTNFPISQNIFSV